jgi:hypothetical protein
LLLTILLNEKATDKSLYKMQTIMPGIERGQRDEKVAATTDAGEWYRVSERSMRGMMSMAILTALTLGLFDLKK